VTDSTLDEEVHLKGSKQHLAKCGPARKVCSLMFRKEWSSSDCQHEIKRFVSAGCTFVELHHFDIAVAQAFREHGYEIMTFLREPAMRIASEINKHLMFEKKSLWQVFHNPSSAPSVPDQSMMLLTSCRDSRAPYDRVLKRRSIKTAGGPSSCTYEFTQAGPILGRVGRVIDERLAGTTCEDGKNVTNKQYAVLYDAARQHMSDMSFVGVLERMDLMLRVWAAQFGVTADLPALIHSNQKTDDEHDENNFESDLKGLRKHLIFDGKLWCDMSASLTKLATELSVDMAGDDGMLDVLQGCKNHYFHLHRHQDSQVMHGRHARRRLRRDESATKVAADAATAARAGAVIAA